MRILFLSFLGLFGGMIFSVAVFFSDSTIKSIAINALEAFQRTATDNPPLWQTFDLNRGNVIHGFVLNIDWSQKQFDIRKKDSYGINIYHTIRILFNEDSLVRRLQFVGSTRQKTDAIPMEDKEFRFPVTYDAVINNLAPGQRISIIAKELPDEAFLAQQIYIKE